MTTTIRELDQIIPADFFGGPVALFAADNLTRLRRFAMPLALAACTFSPAVFARDVRTGTFVPTRVANAPPPPADGFDALLASISEGKLPTMTSERRVLAERAVSASAKPGRRNEDVNAWAASLARSVSHADD